MHEPSAFDYALIRVVPRVERGEFINVGVIVHCPTQEHLVAKVALDEQRLRALSADPALNVAELRAHLDVLVRIAAGDPNAGPLARLPRSQRFHWLVAPRSTVVQTSDVHSGLTSKCEDVAGELLARLVLT